MSKQKESQVSATLMKHLHKMLPGSFWTKVHMTAYQATLLDIIGCWKGWYITIETKMKGESLTARQRIVGIWQENCGAIVLKFERDEDIPFSTQAELLALTIRQKVNQKEKELCSEIHVP
jgi:hypothetical protein